MENPDLLHVNKLVGVSPKAKDYLVELSSDHSKWMEDQEVEKTEAERMVIEHAQNYLQRYLSAILPADRLAELTLPEESIHLLQPGGVKIVSKDTFGGGVYSPRLHAIIVERVATKASLATMVFHELTHAYSYKSFRQNEEGDLYEYRLGLEVRGAKNSPEDHYLLDLNEGVSQYLSRLFFNDWIKEYPESVDDKSITDKDIHFGPLAVWDYFNAIVEALYNAKSEDFKDKQEVIDLIVKAAYDGNIIRLGKLIESVYGKGGLRRMAQTAMYNS